MLLLAVLPESTLPGGFAASASVKLPLETMLKPAHSWSAVTMTSVFLSFLANATAAATASSKAFISSRV
ncbi:hypothetical protein [Miltoncostaea oceani]|uniref:hypothetical protein n=1 Tax=Miltoncostaea oceani TaxID=2843216 RepID=UPI001FE9052D|nr:hypothetical protein [Miltoncostaea oceani]